MAVALFYVTIGSYWAYAERMGIGFRITMQQVHWLLCALAAVTYAVVHRRCRNETIAVRVS